MASKIVIPEACVDCGALRADTPLRTYWQGAENECSFVDFLCGSTQEINRQRKGTRTERCYADQLAQQSTVIHDLVAALDKIEKVGGRDSYGCVYTTGEGHQRCREIAREALAKVPAKYKEAPHDTD